jgi:hypothetical protein
LDLFGGQQGSGSPFTTFMWGSLITVRWQFHSPVYTYIFSLKRVPSVS